MVKNQLNGKKRIVLVGASVGKDWKIQELPTRINSDRYAFEFISNYSFDKSKEINELIDRVEDKPDAIIIKECAAYFPGDTEYYKTKIIEWVHLCKAKGIIPILATVVSVTDNYPFRMFAVNLLRKKFKFPSKTFQTFGQIIIFNNWISDYGLKEGLVVLDLEAAVRINSSNRHLKPEFAKFDGLHLNQKTYELLDNLLILTLGKISWK